MAAPFSKVTVSDEVAKRTLMKAVINADTARAIVDACVEWQKAQPGNQSIAIFVLSPTGQIIDSHQMDGVLPIGAETGLMKAKTALYARSSSAAVAQRFKDVDGRLIRLDLGKEEGLSYYFVSRWLADRCGQPAHRCGWRGRRQCGRTVRVSGAGESAGAAAAGGAAHGTRRWRWRRPRTSATIGASERSLQRSGAANSAAREIPLRFDFVAWRR